MNTDPIERLRRANPVDADRLRVDPHEQANAEALYRSIITRPPSEGRRWRRLLVAGGTAVVLLLVAVGVFVGVRSRSARRLAVDCHMAADLTSPEIVLSPAGGLDPTRVCNMLWQEGAFGPAGSAQLSECRATDTVDVYPGTATVCPSVQEAEVASGITPDKIDLVSSLGLELRDHPCPSVVHAQQAAHNDLAHARLSQWTVRTGTGFSASRRCAAFYLEIASEVITVIPNPFRH